MIRILGDYEQGFIDYINSLHLTDQEVKLTILQGYDCIKNSDGTVAFAQYSPEDKEIMLPTVKPEIPTLMEDFTITNIAHEYAHFLQDVRHEPFDEANADKAAELFVKKFKKSKYARVKK